MLLHLQVIPMGLLDTRSHAKCQPNTCKTGRDIIECLSMYNHHSTSYVVSFTAECTAAM